ncbi:hypothetical protein C8N47_10979 [Mangrovibacterium marinum]|uniref:Uncharacterized protein n=1 Tax=Mangrovibacterium marinum TaxID=1639118 RepID=A0A2T5C137_9BACT|nr:hypothetical protein C8N47_10979 [Mangrovibacterium marinum]
MFLKRGRNQTESSEKSRRDDIWVALAFPLVKFRPGRDGTIFVLSFVLPKLNG